VFILNNLKSFRMNTYIKARGGGLLLLTIYLISAGSCNLVGKPGSHVLREIL
jgi:hypothetical protein